MIEMALRYRDGLAAHSYSHPNKLGDDLFDPFRNLGIGQLVAVKRITGSINKSRNDETAEIEHETVSKAHDRHITAYSTSCAKKPTTLSSQALPVSSTMFLAAAATS